MCTLCQLLSPKSETYDFHGLQRPDAFSRAHNTVPNTAESVGVTTGQSVDGKAIFSLDQVSEQLVDGYWESNGGSARSFDLDASRTLVVEISELTTAGQDLAINALQAWSEVTGITFEYSDPVAPGTTFYEFGDAPANVNTMASIVAGDRFEGTLSAAGDKDWVAVYLEAGQVYTISLTGDASANELSDPYLRLYNSDGTQLGFNDDGGQAYDSLLIYTATESGTHFIEADSFNSAGSGGYILKVTNGSNAAPDITFDDNDSGAYASSITSGGRILSSSVNISTSWLETSGTSLNSYSYQTYLHEIGHALGLGHAGNYNGAASYNNDAHFANDSWQMTVMSYFSQSENAFTNASFGYVATPQMADILAIQTLYGADGARTGDTTYGIGASADASVNILGNQAVTLYDGGGIDHIDLSTKANAQRIDLNAETFSDINGRIGNLAIARGTVIENVTTGSGADTIIGNDAGNLVIASGGDDIVYGRDGADTLIGHFGNDTLFGGTGNDRLVGGGDGDTLHGGSGSDRLEGGFGEDTLRGDAGDDTLFGGYHADTMAGGDGIDRLYGEHGNDHLTGGSGRDYLFGGAGNDVLAGGFDGDMLHGEDGDDILFGGRENDLLSGGGGSDRLFGEDGYDILVGGGAVDYLIGGADDDRLEGGAEGDVLRGGTQNDLLFGGTGNDHLFGEDDNDVLYGETGADRLTGGRGNDTLSGGADGDEFIFADGFGADTIIDYEVGLDVINLIYVLSITTFDDLVTNHLTYSLSGATILAGVDMITLNGVGNESLTEQDFLL